MAQMQMLMQRPAYMEALEGLSAAGLMLVDQLKEAGRQVRLKDEEMRCEGGKVARRLEEELRQLKAHHTTSLQSIVDRLAATTSPSPPQDLLVAFVEEAQAQRTALAAKREELERLRETPPGAEARQRSIDAFNATLDLLTQECEASGERLGRRMRVPWQLQQCAAINADDHQPVVPLEGGRIIDADGNNVWGSECYLCGWEIQDGAKGEGVPRFHSLEVPRADQCVDCFHCWASVWRSVPPEDEAARELLLKHNPHLAHLPFFVEEDNVDVFLRDPIIEASTLADSVHMVFNVYGPRPCLGVRRRQPVSEDSATARYGPYEWLTYDEVYQRATEIGCGLAELARTRQAMALARQSREEELAKGAARGDTKPGAFVSICSSNRPEWLIVDFGCAMHGLITVGLHTSWPLDELVYVMNNSEADYVVADWDNFEKFVRIAPQCPHLKGVFVMLDNYHYGAVSGADHHQQRLDQWKQDHAETLHLRVESLSWLQRKGKHDAKLLRRAKRAELQAHRVARRAEEQSAGEQQQPPPAPSGSEDPVALFSLIYSSGTTGVPKGIIATKGGWRSDNVNSPRYLVPDAVLSYAALAHGMDRGMCWQTLANGGRVGICSRGEENVLDDARALNPVLFVAMPHVWTRIYLDYRQALAAELLLEESGDEAAAKQRVLARFSTILGTRLMQAATGGSATSPQVMEFLRECLKCPVVDAYGTTETPGVATDGVIPSTVTVRLRDVPEMGYHTTDQPHPRGEICVRTPSMTPGYYRLPDHNAASFKDGFFLTGDIGEIDAEGKLHIIDRKKNIIDLYIDGRSVWVPVGLLEAFYLAHASKAIKQIFIHGERTQPCLAAVVVPQRDAGPVSADDLRQAIQEAARLHGQPDHHVPGVVIVEEAPEGWTPDNGCLTVSHKLARQKLMARYKLAIDMAYARAFPL